MITILVKETGVVHHITMRDPSNDDVAINFVMGELEIGQWESPNDSQASNGVDLVMNEDYYHALREVCEKQQEEWDNVR